MKVLVAEREYIHPDAIKILQEKGFKLEFAGSNDLLKESGLKDADYLVIRSFTRITKEVLEKADKLKAIATCTVGTDHIDMEACKANKIKVYNAPGANANAVAEHTVALVLAVLRKITRLDRSVRKGKWERSELSYELTGRTLGLVGIGAIGRLVAEKLEGFGMKALAFDPYLTPEQVREAGALKVDKLLDLLKQSDVISVHVPLTPETRNLIGGNELSMMKADAILVNTSRGGVVDEDALTKALEEKKIYGAGLDVFEQEPPKGSKLLKLENTVLTPHTGTMTERALRDMSVKAVSSMV